MKKTSIDIKINLKEFQLESSFEIPAHGIVALLGPSGSGKTTILRSLAGLLRPDQGRISHGNEIWYDSAERINIPPQLRNIGVVFQDYALFPHLTVQQNIGYGLPRQLFQTKTSHWVERLHLQKFTRRYPHQLSGGQRQRVALARALARDPKLLLLDEPFSALDQQCRQFLRRELQRVISEVQCPVLMVTHHIADARYLSDHVAIQKDGKLLEMAPAEVIFRKPKSMLVARILGWKNFLKVEDSRGDQAMGAWGVVDIPDSDLGARNRVLSIRPEHIEIAKGSKTGILASIEQVTDLGATRNVDCRLQDGSSLQVSIPWNELVAAPGSSVYLHLPVQHIHVLSLGHAGADDQINASWDINGTDDLDDWDSFETGAN